ncbi:bud site selection protein 20 isoform X2 [Ricinus communis]|uniref:bud site selection protein 20 isoform X2 n=1 Tax=Ricinus communis TaxID=3988 RepID=UPI0007722EFF|nr:bud site selection protein 20 isoform X2 [Ricinus communis]|eukprot:XP_015574897.1 bud site selection protein 20 isoform X2 [Ricinus communis]
MGGKCPSRKVKKRRYSHKTARRSKFLVKGDDMVYDELKKPDSEKKSLPLDEDLPGMGQYYCLHCDRYFANVTIRDDHFKSKRHKKRSGNCMFLGLKLESVTLWLGTKREANVGTCATYTT